MRSMAKTRAIMTDTERERIAGLEDVEEIKRYQAISRVRRRIQEELTFDVEILEEHEPELYQELVDAVCPDRSDERGESAARRDQGDRRERDHPPQGDEPPADRDGSHDRASAAAELAEIDLPGSGRTEGRRRETVLDMWEYLRNRGSAEKADLLALVDVDEVEYASTDSFWSNVVKTRRALQQLPGVEPPAEGGRTWRYREG